MLLRVEVVIPHPREGKRELRFLLGVYPGAIGRQVEVTGRADAPEGTVIKVTDAYDGEVLAWVEAEAKGELRELV